MEAVLLTEDQIRILLTILDCATLAGMPDWYYNEESQMVETPFRDDTGAPYKERTVQEHLDILLKEENFPQLFDEDYVEED